MRRHATILLGSLLLLATPAAAPAQTRWTIDAKSSLAWWQVSPHLNHLWATTCPGDSSWRPGEGRSSGWYINPKLKPPKTGYANVDDTVHVPMYPRKIALPVCVEAVAGEVYAPDTVHWRGVHGKVTIVGDALITGEMMRDVLMHQAMQTSQYPNMDFTLDSLTNIVQRGDTLNATAVGTFNFRAAPNPMTASVKAFHDAGGMRVMAKMRVKATALKDWAPKLRYLGLGVNTNIWHDFFMGLDAVFREAPAHAASGN